MTKPCPQCGSAVPVQARFCGQCGTPLFYDGGHDHISITLGSLDDPQSVKPELQTNLARKMSWFGELGTLPHDQRMDTSAQDGDEIARSSRQHPDHDTQDWPPEGRS